MCSTIFVIDGKPSNRITITLDSDVGPAFKFMADESGVSLHRFANDVCREFLAKPENIGYIERQREAHRTVLEQFGIKGLMQSE